MRMKGRYEWLIRKNMRIKKSVEKDYQSCIIQNEELNKKLHDALVKYFSSLPEERLLEIESYMTLD